MRKRWGKVEEVRDAVVEKRKRAAAALSARVRRWAEKAEDAGGRRWRRYSKRGGGSGSGKGVLVDRLRWRWG